MGFIGPGFAGAVKEETKRVSTSGQWEDVGRIRAQTYNLAGLRVWQLLALSITALMWSYAWFKYGEDTAVIINNPMSQALTVILALAVLTFGAVVCYDLYRAELNDGMFLAMIAVVCVCDFFVISALVPVAVWVLINVIAIGYAPIAQMITCGWIPFLLAIISAAIVPDFQVGRFAFRHELINQPEASSEKNVLDRTAIEIKRMELDAKHDELTDEERAEYESQIEELQNKVDSLMKSKPVTRLVPFNHGSARSVNGSDFTDSEWENMRLFLAGWSKRGISRDAWCTEAAERKHGSRIPEPDWYKFRDVLRGLGVYDVSNKPTMSADEAAKIIKIDIYD